MKFCAVALIFCAATTSCKSSKSATGGGETAVGGITLADRFDILAEKSGEWTELNVPIRVDLKKPMSLSASGRAYLRRGNDIYISLKVLGLEVAVIYIDKDSLYAADKFHRICLVEPIKNLMGDASLTINDIQDVLIGRVFVNSQGTITKGAYKNVALTQGDGVWTITPKSRIAGARYAFDINLDGNTLRSLSVDYNGRKVSCDYSSPAETTLGTFMQQARVATSVKGKALDVALRWSWGSAKQSVDSSVKWRQPSGYKRVTAASLISTLSSI